MLVRVVCITTLLLALSLPSSVAGADNPVLEGTVGTNDAFVITLLDPTGAKVTHLNPGTYTIVVHDRSAEHNFHLDGPGVNQTTDVEGIGDETWTVTFTDGIYGYQCDPHAGIMKGRFAVGTAQLPAPTAALTGRVGPGRSISVRDANGLKVTVLSNVTSVRLTVNDRSKTDNFHLTGPGVNKATGVKYRGRVTWNLKVSTGVYRFRSDRHKSLRGSFSVTDVGYRAG
jgi:Copper binding proteins, plastocyanin/azurin family